MALSGIAGERIHEANKARVRGALAAWSGQKGQVWLDELKQCVSADMMKCRPNGKLTEAQLLERIDAFFNEVRG